MKTAGLRIRPYQSADEISVIALWRECGLLVPWNNPRADIKGKCSDSPDLFFVADLDSKLVCSCMAGFDGHRGWIYYLAVKNGYQKRGIATTMLVHVESVLAMKGCPKLELMIRESNEAGLSFYRENNYQTEPVQVLSKRLIDDEPHDFL